MYHNDFFSFYPLLFLISLTLLSSLPPPYTLHILYPTTNLFFQLQFTGLHFLIKSMFLSLVLDEKLSLLALLELLQHILFLLQLLSQCLLFCQLGLVKLNLVEERNNH